MKIAIIKTGGKQYKVKKGQAIKVEKLNGKMNEKIKFDTLMISNTDGKEVDIGKPSLGEKVEGKIIEQGRNKKISVVKYKNKTRYKRNLGHKQMFSKVEITNILGIS
ncbi:50S ribosomal protein L21 [Patescibacteria group bacterium]|nr:50S ribosomal protein L21 [Patescibacteria group bacterium]MBU1420982.1 50S ribosomal protein L21 [Patescibacteria group bacterium]